MVAGTEKEFHPRNGRQFFLLWQEGEAAFRERMLMHFSFDKRMGPDHTTLVGRRCRLVTMEPWSGWSALSLSLFF